MDLVVENSIVRPFILVDLAFSSGTLYIHSGLGDMVWDGETYQGVGDLLKISPTEESGDLGAKGATVTLNGLNDDLVQKARDEDYQGRTAIIRLGAFNEAVHFAAGAGSPFIVADPTIIFSGFMDVMSIDIGSESSTITVQLENKLIKLGKSKERRYTAEDQKIEYPDDKGFDFVAKIQDQELVWGMAGGGSSAYHPAPIPYIPWPSN
jgi:hypothetical protein